MTIITVYAPRHAINFAFLSDIRDKLTPETELQEVMRTTDRMFDEMQGYAEAASFDELSRITAKDALEKFVHGAEAFERPGLPVLTVPRVRLDERCMRRYEAYVDESDACQCMLFFQ